MATSTSTESKYNSAEELAKALNEAKELHCHTTNDDPAVYVGTYGQYNDGSLYGAWVNLSTFNDYDELMDFCHLLHHSEEDPEFMYQDYENFPSSWYSESCMDEETFDRIIEISRLDEDEREAYEDYLDDMNDNATIEEFREHYEGEWDDEEAFAEHIIEECYSDKLNDDFFSRYFDYEKFASDLFCDDYYFTNGHVYRR